MKTKKQIVRLREKALSNGNKSLYLDIYWNGQRQKEYLKLYIIKPKAIYDREINKQTMALAENIRAKRQTEIQNNKWGIFNEFKLDTNFIEYFEHLAGKSERSNLEYDTWYNALTHIKKYTSNKTTFKDVDTNFVEGFKYYLHTTKTKFDKLLSTNSQHIYFNIFRSGLKQAYENRIIPVNPAKSVKPIRQEQPHREYLTFEEIKKLSKTECSNPGLKNAFLFSCLTGLRWSDIYKLKWSEVQREGDNYRVIFRQQKTKGQEYLDISNQARDLLGPESDPNNNVFTCLTKSGWNSVELARWLLKAGIARRITFHSARHTFAVLQLSLNTDIYTVSKLLGHKSLVSTQVYAKIIDAKKKEAMNKIPDINI